MSATLLALTLAGLLTLALALLSLALLPLPALALLTLLALLILTLPWLLAALALLPVLLRLPRQIGQPLLLRFDAASEITGLVCRLRGRIRFGRLAHRGFCICELLAQFIEASGDHVFGVAIDLSAAAKRVRRIASRFRDLSVGNGTGTASSSLRATCR